LFVSAGSPNNAAPDRNAVAKAVQAMLFHMQMYIIYFFFLALIIKNPLKKTFFHSVYESFGFYL